MDKKIRLLQVIPRLDVGGAETGCKDIAQFIAEQNSSSRICFFMYRVIYPAILFFSPLECMIVS